MNAHFMQALPLEFDPDYYNDRNKDLRGRNYQQLLDHYKAYGRREGRASSAAAYRADFLQLIPTAESVLEIGPFGRPCIRGDNVRYFEVLDQASLQARADVIGYAVSEIPYIHYVEPTGDLSVVKDSFAAVVSSHCIEHQPDLVYHLQQVERILEPGGRYFLIVPNKLYCFDRYIAESTIANVVDAHRNRYRVHRLESVIEHRALTTHNDPLRHWSGDHADPTYWATVASRTRAALAEFDAAKGGYVDVHAWQFTPESFRKIIEQLIDLKLTSLAPVRVYETPINRNEFTAILQKP